MSKKNPKQAISPKEIACFSLTSLFILSLPKLLYKK